MAPALPTNERNSAAAQDPEASKNQPTIVKRFEQLRAVHEIAPPILNSSGLLDAFFVMHFSLLSIQALLRGKLRGAKSQNDTERRHLDCSRIHADRTATRALRDQRHLKNGEIHSVLCFRNCSDRLARPCSAAHFANIDVISRPAAPCKAYAAAIFPLHWSTISCR
jgi:hypothetical protein